MALAHPAWIVAALLSLAIALAVANPALVVGGFHLHPSNPMFGVYRFLYLNKTLAVAAPAVIAGTSFLGTWSMWSLTYVELDRNALTYRLGPFSANSIPLRAIQDVSFSKGVVGLMFDYGTLHVQSGLQAENIPFVPDVATLAQMLRQAPAA